MFAGKLEMFAGKLKNIRCQTGKCSQVNKKKC